ncbi:hypothetical protein PLICRDRAFT_377439 [Plicaturopsis crispa FD-325 SS-3]|nr:hypothetical protein PLICRDRAFT_377439 [Plicaturopsis crispa FD-325 SS-3]
MTTLKDSAPTLPLCQNLQRLTLDNEHLEYLEQPEHMSALLLVPRLTSCALTLAPQALLSPPSLNSLRSTRASLSTLKIDIAHTYGDTRLVRDVRFSTRSGIAAVLDGWHSLHTLTIHGLDADGMSTVSSLPSLERLIIDEIALTDLPLGSRNTSPALRHLDLTSPELLVFPSFLRLLTPHHPLEAISIHEICNADAVPHQWRELTEALRDHVAAASLTKIAISSGRSASPDYEASTPDDLRSLLHFHALRHLIFPCIEWHSGLSDELLDAMSISWPLLQDLDLLGYRRLSSSVTWGGVAHMILSCRHLETLRLPVEFTVHLPIIASDDLPNTTLSVLQVAGEEQLISVYPPNLHEGSKLRRFLNRLCPNAVLSLQYGYPIWPQQTEYPLL